MLLGLSRFLIAKHFGEYIPIKEGGIKKGSAIFNDHLLPLLETELLSFI